MPAGAMRAGAIDCDIHPAVPGMAALLPYLDDHWREQVTTRGIDGLDLASYPPAIPANARPDWRGARVPGSDLQALQRDALDAFGIRFAICNCLYGVAAVHNPDLGAALATAVNDWLAAEWLSRDARLRGSIVISLQDPALAVAEIERRAADPRFVQVLVLAMGVAPVGRRQFWPIWEAAARHRLPLGIHAGSMFRHATTSNGWPSTYIEDQASQAHAFQAQLLSLVAEGVFARCPDLTVVLIESGWTWLANFLWRANKTWRAMRAEVPWVKQPPAELIRRHVRLTLQPVDAPPRPDDLSKLLAQIGDDRMLLFSTDYPHWHFDAAAAVPEGLPEKLLARLLCDNALETYPRLREGLP
jgi:predicted TIM-barrel fold metal-dependent hydrolase